MKVTEQNTLHQKSPTKCSVGLVLAASCRLCANFEFQIKYDAEIVHGNEYYEPVFRVRSIMAESPKTDLKYFE